MSPESGVQSLESWEKNDSVMRRALALQQSTAPIQVIAPTPETTSDECVTCGPLIRCIRVHGIPRDPVQCQRCRKAYLTPEELHDTLVQEHLFCSLCWTIFHRIDPQARAEFEEKQIEETPTPMMELAEVPRFEIGENRYDNALEYARVELEKQLLTLVVKISQGELDHYRRFVAQLSFQSENVWPMKQLKIMTETGTILQCEPMNNRLVDECIPKRIVFHNNLFMFGGVKYQDNGLFAEVTWRPMHPKIFLNDYQDAPMPDWAFVVKEDADGNLQ